MSINKKMSVINSIQELFFAFKTKQLQLNLILPCNPDLIRNIKTITTTKFHSNKAA